MTIAEALRVREGKRLVFTNGVFDILHVGHATYLAAARQLGGLLIVGVNSDASVKRLGKGDNRPVHTASDRLALLEALKSVDGAVVFDEDTPEDLIGKLKPEVHVKGGDYEADALPETKLVRSYGGEVVIIPFVAGHSTTGILKKLESE